MAYIRVSVPVCGVVSGIVIKQVLEKFARQIARAVETRPGIFLRYRIQVEEPLGMAACKQKSDFHLPVSPFVARLILVQQSSRL